VELMVAMAVLTIGVFSLVGTFHFIQVAVQLSKNRTMASNLAQEKMQILKQKTYYQILVTSVPAHDSADFAPEVVDYDTGYFPPENIVEAGVNYTRYTYVQSLHEDSGVLSDLAPGTPDVGMKRLTVTVVWGQGDGKRKVTLRSVVSNPDTVMANVVFNGVVKSAAGVAISGALVKLVEGASWSDTTDSGGNYKINATPGTFTLLASAAGYYNSSKSVVIAAGNTMTTNFNLNAIATGNVTGYPWLIDHLVISQVVGSTIDVSVTPAFDQEYVEVFNPTLVPRTMNGAVGLNFQRVGRDNWCLVIRPEMRITKDGVTPIDSSKIGGKVTRRKSRMFNYDLLEELQFWRDYLSDSSPRIVFPFEPGQHIVVSNRLMESEIDWPGIPEEYAKPFRNIEPEEDLFTAADREQLEEEYLDNEDEWDDAETEE